MPGSAFVDAVDAAQGVRLITSADGIAQERADAVLAADRCRIRAILIGAAPRHRRSLQGSPCAGGEEEHGEWEEERAHTHILQFATGNN